MRRGWRRWAGRRMWRGRKGSCVSWNANHDSGEHSTICNGALLTTWIRQRWMQNRVVLAGELLSLIL